MKQSRSRRPPSFDEWIEANVKYLFLALTAIATCALVAIALGQVRPQSQITAHSVPSDYATPAPPRSPVSVFLGDSYTEGMGADSPTTAFPYLVASAMGWEARTDGETGSGYVTSGIAEDSTPYPERAATIPADADFIIISGGINDAEARRRDPQAFTAAVQSTLEAARVAAPGAIIIAMGPFWPWGEPNQNILQMRDDIADAAKNTGSLFIDPIEEGWQTASAGMLLEDGLHPNQAGYDNLAARTVKALTALSITAGR